MTNDLTKIICDTIEDAIQKSNTTSGKDMTYLCTVTQVYQNNVNTYQLTCQNVNYVVELKHIRLKLNDTVHLVIPQGNFKNKYVLEDTCYNHLAENKDIQIDENELETTVKNELKGE